MNYSRIYSEFIADRVASQHTLAGYVERHHIIPKSHGGSDDKSNLVKLTAEDHFFAHLLLAKIYGGGMWVAVQRMRWGRVGGSRPWVQGRYMYGVAVKRKAIETSSRCKGQDGAKGADNGRYNHEALEWHNLDTGAKMTATKWEMWDRFGGTRGTWTAVAHGNRKTMLGWTTRPDSVIIRGNKGKHMSFVNRDGRSFTGTQGQLCATYGVGVASASRMARHRSVTLCGWRLEGTLDRDPRAAKLG